MRLRIRTLRFGVLAMAVGLTLPGCGGSVAEPGGPSAGGAMAGDAMDGGAMDGEMNDAGAMESGAMESGAMDDAP